MPPVPGGDHVADSELVRACRPALLMVLPAAGGVTVEIRGRITDLFTEERYRAAIILITDRLGTEIPAPLNVPLLAAVGPGNVRDRRVR